MSPTPHSWALESIVRRRSSALAGTVAGCRLGNAAAVEFMREAISSANRDPARNLAILWHKVIYSGTHTGDWLTLAEVRQLKKEIPRVRLQSPKKMSTKDRQFFHEFLANLDMLIAASLNVKKPIVF